MNKKTPNPIDIHVGSRVRMRRMLIGMSQSGLAESLGITFQQIQKYEKGTNRIGSSRLADIAKALSVAPQWFFDGAPGAADDSASNVDMLAGFDAADIRIARAASTLAPPLKALVLRTIQAYAESNDAMEVRARQKAEKPAGLGNGASHPLLRRGETDPHPGTGR